MPLHPAARAALVEWRGGGATPAGSKVEVCLEYDDVEEMARHFEALAAGGSRRLAPTATND